MIRKITPLGLALFLALSSQPALAAGEAAQGAGPVITLQVNNPVITVNDRQVMLGAMPTQVDGTTMVPLRLISESLGAQVTWEESSGTVTLTTASATILLTIGQMTAQVNGKPVALEQPAMMMNNSTMVPLRFIAEALGQQVQYDSDTRSVKLSPAVAAKPRKLLQEPAALGKLDQPAVESLTKAWEAGFDGSRADPGSNGGVEKSIAALDMVTDDSGNVYLLHRSAEGAYRVMKYDSKNGGALSLAVPLDKRFNTDITYEANTYSYTYDEFIPSKLFYSESNGKLYLKCDLAAPKTTNTDYLLRYRLKLSVSMIYEISPEVKLVTYQAKSEDSTRDHEFLATPDGNTFYFSNQFEGKIYQGIAGERSEVLHIPALEASAQPVASIDGSGSLVLFDKKNKTLSRLEPDGLHTIAQVQTPGDILYAAPQFGSFYFSTAEGFYKLDAKGTVTPYALLKDLSYGKDQQPELRLTASTVFAVNPDGNVILYDSARHILRMIRIYGKQS